MKFSWENNTDQKKPFCSGENKNEKTTTASRRCYNLDFEGQSIIPLDDFGAEFGCHGGYWNLLRLYSCHQIDINL